jgi:uncharacterized protein DUF1918
MKAQVGDRLILPGAHVGDPQRVGLVIKVHGPGGAPPYLVRWEGSGHETLCFPGPDAHVDAATPAG